MLERITPILSDLSGAKALFVPMLVVFLAIMVPAPPANAQALEDRQLQSQKELEELKAEITLSEQRRDEMIRQIENLDKDRTTITRSLIETTKKSRALNKRIETTGNRLLQLREEQGEIRQSLSGKKELLAEILGALQRMGRKPPPALLVTPEDALSSVRSAILLGSVIPEVRSETDILVNELRELTRISKDIETQREAVKADLASLAQEEERLNLLLEEKREIASAVSTDLAQESARAAEMAAKANSLNDLIASLETEIASARAAAEAAAKAEAERKKREETRIAAAKKYQSEEAFSDPGRIAPAIGFDDARGLLPLPVNGEIAALFGENDGVGGVFKGISVEAGANTRVIAPADGWIVYAGPFRSYGQLLIINAGTGYHIVLAGMANINVSPGQFVIVGEPVGTMGAQRLASIGKVGVSTTKPILYVEFRKDGISIDPTPWWADINLERESNGS